MTVPVVSGGGLDPSPVTLDPLGWGKDDCQGKPCGGKDRTNERVRRMKEIKNKLMEINKETDPSSSPLEAPGTKPHQTCSFLPYT